MFTRIDHVGVAVADLDQAVEFYQHAFGMRLAHQETNEDQGVREAMMEVGGSGVFVQLLAPLRSRNLAIVESGVSGASSCTNAPEWPTSIMASRTPWPWLTSWWASRIPNACW